MELNILNYEILDKLDVNDVQMCELVGVRKVLKQFNKNKISNVTFHKKLVTYLQRVVDDTFFCLNCLENLGKDMPDGYGCSECNFFYCDKCATNLNLLDQDDIDTTKCFGCK
jgi:hypothetical protein